MNGTGIPPHSTEETPYALEPLDTGALVDRAFRIYSDHFPLLASIVLITHIPMVMVNVVQALLQPGSTTMATFEPVQILALAGAMLLGLLLFVVLVYPVSVGATTFAVGEIYLGRSVDVGDCFARSFDRLWQLLVVQMNVSARVLLWTLLFIIPGIMKSFSYMAVVPVTMLELKKGEATGKALERSTELTYGHRWRMLKAMAVVGVITFMASLVAGVVVRFIPGDGLMTILLGSVISSLVQMLATPLGLVLNVLIYYDLRIRKEGFDLEMLNGSVSALNASTSPYLLQK